MVNVNYIADKTGYHPKVSMVLNCNEDSNNDYDNDDDDNDAVRLRYDINYRNVFNLKNVGKVDNGRSLYMPENNKNGKIELNETIKNSLIS